MTSPADEDDQDALAAEWEAAEGGDAEDGGEGQDDLATEWESMVDDGEEGEGGGEGEGIADEGSRESTRVLNQEEIDSLLGFDEEHEDASEKSGIQAILSSALVSYERLPMLEVVFDRLVRLMSTSLRNFTSDNVEVSLDNIALSDVPCEIRAGHQLPF